jgi:alkylation response protein AidB-like acyl-CoA dehydrogenase
VRARWLQELKQAEAGCAWDQNAREHLVLTWAKHFQDTGLYKVCLPKHIGGLALGLIDFMELTREMAGIDANLAWRFQIANGATYFYQYYHPSQADSIYALNEVLVSGSGTPSGVGKPTSSGYLVSGNWAYCSGSDLATHVSFVFQVPQTGECLAAIVPFSSAIGFQSYSFSGMQFTATSSMYFDDLYVPLEACFHLDEKVNGNKLAAFNYPFKVFARAFFIPVLIGSAERYFHELDHYKFTSKRYSELDFNQVSEGFQQLVKSYYACLDFIRQDQYDFFEKDVVQLAIHVNKLIHSSLHLAGMEALMSNKPIHYCYQNSIAVAQHYLLNRC